jgi:hypothetical protein
MTVAERQGLNRNTDKRDDDIHANFEEFQWKLGNEDMRTELVIFSSNQ